MRPWLCSLFVSLVVVAACTSDDNDAATLPKVTSTVSHSIKDTVPASPTPTAMSTAELEAEITAFFEDYIDTVNKSWTSKKALERRRTMFKDSCRDCLAGYLFAKRAHDENLTISGDDIQILDVKIAEVTPDSATALTTENSPPGELTDESGTVVKRFDEYMNARTLYKLGKVDDQWIIVRSDPL